MRCLICWVLVLALNPVMRSETPIGDSPRWAKQLKIYGWSVPKPESNGAFFKDFTLSKLQAVDTGTRVAFISEARAVVFHTQQVGQDWRTASRQLQALFVSTDDGSLLTKKEWSTSIRGSENDGIDSEGRLIALNQDAVAVIANQTIILYDQRLQMVKERRLEPSAVGDLWSVQSVANGQKLFVRHQSSADQRTAYSWLDSASLSEVSTMSGPNGKQLSVPVTPGENFVLTSSKFLRPGASTGIVKLNSDGSVRTICSEQLCREDHVMAYSSPFLIVSGRSGIAVADMDQGLRWLKQIPASSNPNEFRFGSIRTSMSGNTFAVWLTSMRNTSFDGMPLGKTPRVYVYDTESGKLLATFLIEPKSGDFDFDLSPNGRQLIIFDGATVSLYAVPRA
jgi:hypothetical protein